MFPETPRYIKDARRKAIDDLYTPNTSSAPKEKSKKELKREKKRYEKNVEADNRQADKVRKRLEEQARKRAEYDRWDPRNKA